MGFRESPVASVLHDAALAKGVMLSRGTVFHLSDISKTVPNYEKLFRKYPDTCFFVLPLPYGNRENPEKAYYVTRNNTMIEDKLLVDEEIMWAAAKDVYSMYGKGHSPHRLFWRMVGFTSEYEDDCTPTPINKRIRDLEINLQQLSKTANALPKQWTKVNMRIGNHIIRRIRHAGYGSSAIVPSEPSIYDLAPTREEREAAGW